MRVGDVCANGREDGVGREGRIRERDRLSLLHHPRGRRTEVRRNTWPVSRRYR